MNECISGVAAGGVTILHYIMLGASYPFSLSLKFYPLFVHLISFTGPYLVNYFTSEQTENFSEIHDLFSLPFGFLLFSSSRKQHHVQWYVLYNQL